MKDLCTYHLLPHGSTPETPLGNPQEPRENGTVLVFLFSPWGRSCLILKNDYAWSRGHTPGICSRQSDRQDWQCFIWFETEQKACKEIGYICYFCQWKVKIILWSDNKRLKKVVMLFLTTSKINYVYGCSYFPLGKGYLSLILCPLPSSFEWFLFVTKNNSQGVSRGPTNEEANDKCITAAGSRCH